MDDLMGQLTREKQMGLPLPEIYWLYKIDGPPIENNSAKKYSTLPKTVKAEINNNSELKRRTAKEEF